MKKTLVVFACALMALALVGCKKKAQPVEYNFGMGVVTSLESSKTGTAQVDATVAVVVTDKDGKIVACRIDVAQNKATVTDGVANVPTSYKTKMEKQDEYGMAGKVDNDGNGVMLEWYDQVYAFEKYVVGKTGEEVKNLPTALVNGHYISTDQALLDAGCSMQITDFMTAVYKACTDEQGFKFETEKEFTVGVAADSFDDGSSNATAEADGVVKMYTDFAGSVIVEGKIVASINDAIQPNVKFNTAGEITTKEYKGTKRELKENYNMAKFGATMDPNGDGKVYEWYLQSQAFSKHVVGMAGAEVAAMETQTNSIGYQMTTDEALLAAGCTIQITDFKAAVVKACNDDQATTFKTSKEFKLGLAAESTVDTEKSVNGALHIGSEFAASVVVDGKIVATLNDAIQPSYTYTETTVTPDAYKGTKREQKSGYGMAPALNYGMDWNGDGVVKEWFEQSAVFSQYVIGKTAQEVLDMPTKVVEGKGYVISAEDALLSAGCTIQISSIKAVVAESVNNAR